MGQNSTRLGRAPCWVCCRDGSDPPAVVLWARDGSPRARHHPHGPRRCCSPRALSAALPARFPGSGRRAAAERSWPSRLRRRRRRRRRSRRLCALAASHAWLCPVRGGSCTSWISGAWQRRCRQQSRHIARRSRLRRLRLLRTAALRHRRAAVAVHVLALRHALLAVALAVGAPVLVPHRPQPRLQRSRRSRWLREPCDARGAVVGLRGPAQLTPAPPGRYGAPVRAVSRAAPLAGLVRADQRQAEAEDQGAGPHDLQHVPIAFCWSGPAQSGAEPGPGPGPGPGSCG